MTPEPDAVGVTELRVHGVSGASAEYMLDSPWIVRVAGDDDAGFYRVHGAGERGSAGITLEAFRWANLTAGAATRTVSRLLLLPFMLSNIALWMLPPGSGPQSVVRAICRLLGGSLTAIYVLSIVGTFVDLVGWQCTRALSCSGDRAYLVWLVQIPVGPRLALLYAVPIVGIWLAGWLGAHSYRHYEIHRPSRTDIARGAWDRLDTPGFWNRARQTATLRMTHQAIAFGVLAVSVLPAFATWPSPAVVLLGPAVLILVAGLVLLCVPDQINDRTARWSFTAARWSRIAAAVLTVLTLGLIAVSSPSPEATGGLPGFEPMVSVLFVWEAVLVAVLLAVCVRAAHRSPEIGAGKRRLGRLSALGAPVASAAGVGFGAAYAAVLLYRVADLLDRGRIPGSITATAHHQPPLEPPLAYRWVGIGTVLTVLTVLAVGLVWLWYYRRYRAPIAARIAERDFPDVPPEARPRLDGVRQAIVRARITDQLPLVLAAFLVLVLSSLVVAVLEVVGVGPSVLVRRLGPGGQDLLRVLWYVTDVGSVLAGLVAVAFLVGGFFAHWSPTARSSIGVLWDLGTFWARVAHPFAPTCYASRAVPDLVRRVTALAHSGPVLLSGHSHGSVLLAAAVLQLPPQVLPRVALLTYGSPLRRLYAELMPAYLGEDMLREVGERVGWRWRNLWRVTDPIGGPIFFDHAADAGDLLSRADGGADAGDPATRVDWRLRDPHSITIAPDDTVPPPIQRHWPYQTDPQYDVAVADLAGMLRAKR